MNLSNAKLLRDAGACELVVDCLTGNTDDPLATEFACWAVVGLASKDVENMRLLGEAGACAALVKILKDNPFRDEIAEECTEAIANLCVCVSDDPPDEIVAINVSNQDRLASENAVGVVMEAIGYCSTTAVNENGSLAIRHLVCNHEPNKQQLLAIDDWQEELEQLASHANEDTTREGRTHARTVMRQLLDGGDVEFDPPRTLADFTSEFDESSSDDDDDDEETGSDVWVSDDGADDAD